MPILIPSLVCTTGFAAPTFPALTPSQQTAATAAAS